ncbi:MAG: flagellar biosynthesis repressor FlbT [Deltaproteobacteria bacterium]|nr:flagellar biosynthesis repressor FlbT [Deltaproteobacteria bacterium]
MALKITLKPHERLILGGAVIENGDARADFIVENNVPILRQKDIMGEEDANTPCRRIYFVIQLMYIDETGLVNHHNTYWQLVQDVVKAAPSTLVLIDQISELILQAKYYQALKLTRKLIDYEKELLDHALSSSGSV